MFRKLACAAAMMFVIVGVLSAETIKGKITKIEGDSLTIEAGKDKAAKTLKIAKDCKVVEGKDKKDVEGGVKGLKIGEKGMGAVVTTNADGAVTEIAIAGKKKKAAN